MRKPAEQAVTQGRGTLRRVLQARGGETPVEAMAELIEVAARHADVRRELLAEMRKQLWNAERDMALAWLCVVAGEVGRDGLCELIDLLDQTESDDVAEASIHALMRHALEAHDDMRSALNAMRSSNQRECLYEALGGVLVLGDASLKRVLADEARIWLGRELKASSRLFAEPLWLLLALEVPDAQERVAQARSATRGDQELERQLDELLPFATRDGDRLEMIRGTVNETWRDDVVHLRKLFHPTEEETRLLREYTASLVAQRKQGVH